MNGDRIGLVFVIHNSSFAIHHSPFTIHPSNVAPPHLPHQIIHRPNAKRHDGQRRILAGGRGESGGIADEQVLDVVSLLELIEHRFLRIVPHAGDAHFVDGEAGRPVRNDKGANVLRARGFHHLDRGFLHVVSHGALVFAVRHMNVQDRDAERVHEVGIDLDEVVPARQALAESGDADRGLS